MITTDDDLRQAYLSHSQAALPDGHPDSEKLWQLASGELEAAQARSWIDHISRCPACAEDFRLTRQMVSEAAGEVEFAEGRATEESSTAAPTVSAPPEAISENSSVVPFPQRMGNSRWLRNLAAAAAVVLVAGGLGWRLAQPEDVVFRQGGEALVRSLLSTDVAAPRHDAHLRWSGPEGATYDLIVTTEALRVIFEAEGLATTELLIPAAELERLPPDTTLYWHIEAVLPDGSRIPSESFDQRLSDE